MFAIVPAIDGVPQIGTRLLIEAMSISETQAVAHFVGSLEDGWTELTEAEFREYIPAPEPPELVETIEEKIARLEEQNLILMDALATTFEEVLALRTLVEGGTA